MSLINQTVTLLFETLSKGGWLGLRSLINLIQENCKRIQDREKLPERERNAARGICIPIDRQEFIQPDPMLYAQYFLMSLGLAVTWDNPDIRVFEGGSEVTNPVLKPGREYLIQARIWNGSTSCPVLAMPVHFSYLDFGIGGVSVPIGTAKTDLGVKGGANHPAFISIPWVTPTTDGHYCLQVQLEPPDDTNWQNNLGQRNLNVGHTQSPANFTFTLRNNTERSQIYTLETDAYEIGTPPLCESVEENQLDERRKLILLERHRHNQHPVPPNWVVRFNPSPVELPPNESQLIAVSIEPPTGFKGTQHVNVNAFYGNHYFAGGVTLIVIAD